jgi:predicted type IV restriction endonuclease
MALPKKVLDRLISGVKKYQPILANAKARDVNETDTVTIVKDLLNDVFGYDKYTEVTSEFEIRGTYCDLAIKLDNKTQTLIEVKAIGLELKEQHVKQAVDYAANQGVDWVLLTNGVYWRVYHINFSKPIEANLVIDIDFTTINTRSENDLGSLYLWCKEGWQKSALDEYHNQKEALSRYTIGAILLGDAVLDVVRRELRRVTPGVKIDQSKIKEVLLNEVLKREVVDGEKAETARKKTAKAASTQLRAVNKEAETKEKSLEQDERHTE